MKEKKDVFAVAMDFMRSRIILTAAELDLFAHIENGESTAAKLASDLDANERALCRVLDCLVTFGLLDKAGDTYSLTQEGATCSSRHPESTHPMLLHISRLWYTWSGLTEVIKKGPASEEKRPEPMDPESRRAFIGAMHVIGRTLSEEIAGSLNLAGFKKLLDLGGGSGTYTISFLRNNPKMRAVIFDLDDVIPMARERLASEGFLERTELAQGDFYRDELPKGCDLALLSAIIHQNDAEQNLNLYKKVFRALDRGGMILIRDHIMDDSRTRPPQGALFAINMLVNTRGGDTYTLGEVKEGLEAAGFENVKMLRTGERMDCLVCAVKPA